MERVPPRLASVNATKGGLAKRALSASASAGVVRTARVPAASAPARLATRGPTANGGAARTTAMGTGVPPRPTGDEPVTRRRAHALPFARPSRRLAARGVTSRLLRICRRRCEAQGAALPTCACEPGWAGETCGVKVCPDRCSDRGTCLADGTCECDAGWMGDSCALPSCEAGASRLATPRRPSRPVPGARPGPPIQWGARPPSALPPAPCHHRAAVTWPSRPSATAAWHP